MKKHLLKTLARTVIVSCLLYIPVPSNAWGLLGHRIVGEIASGYLSAKAKASVQSILGNETLAMSANWADFIKSDTAYKYLDAWHYVNFDSGLLYNEMKTFLKSDTSVNAYTKLNFLMSELKKKNLPNDKKVMYLRLLVHIVGDLHQPLHASAKGDRGGNDIKVQWFSQATNLHSLWDSGLLEFQQLSYTEYARAINFVTPQRKAKLLSQPISEWLHESYVLSDTIRHEITQPNQRLGYEYNFRYLAKMNDQLLKGGIHLAAILNQVFGS